MLKDIEVIRKVLEQASRAKLHRSQEAMGALVRINKGMLELSELREDVIQAAKDEQEAEDVANGVIAHG